MTRHGSVLVLTGLVVAGLTARAAATTADPFAMAPSGPAASNSALGAMCRPSSSSSSLGARPQVCMDAFFEVLSDYGTWVDAERFGTLFCPDPAAYGPDFRPYSKGHWVLAEDGWTFIGEQPMSWVTDHYGRWVATDTPSCPWGWVPGDTWAPAWVQFRVGENVVAWRPAQYDGVPVRLNPPPGVRLQQVRIEMARPARAPEQDPTYVAVADGDFQANHLSDVELSGPSLHSALRETAYMPDMRAGLHSRTRNEVVAQLQAAHEMERATAELRGEPPEPASRVGRARSRPAVAGTVVAGKKGRERLGGQNGQAGNIPPSAGTVATPGDQGNFQNPGPQGGVKVLEWGKPKQPLPPPQTTP